VQTVALRESEGKAEVEKVEKQVGRRLLACITNGWE
jgi:hypothetical protein